MPRLHGGCVLLIKLSPAQAQRCSMLKVSPIQTALARVWAVNQTTRLQPGIQRIILFRIFPSVRPCACGSGIGMRRPTKILASQGTYHIAIYARGQNRKHLHTKTDHSVTVNDPLRRRAIIVAGELAVRSSMASYREDRYSGLRGPDFPRVHRC